MFKVKRNLVPEMTVNMLETITDLHHYTIQSAAAGDFYVHHTNLSITQKSIAYAGSAVWNKISCYIKETLSLKSSQVKQKDSLVNHDCNGI